MKDLKSHIGFWMRMVSNNISHTFAKKLEKSGVTVAEWVILREMYGKKEPTSPSQIAESTGLTRGAISKLVERLCQKKLIIREEVAEDRRFQDITLTREAEVLVPKLVSIADQNDEEFFNVLTSAEKKQIRELLQKIVRLKKFKSVPTE